MKWLNSSPPAVLLGEERVALSVAGKTKVIRGELPFIEYMQLSEADTLKEFLQGLKDTLALKNGSSLSFFLDSSLTFFWQGKKDALAAAKSCVPLLDEDRVFLEGETGKNEVFFFCISRSLLTGFQQASQQEKLELSLFPLEVLGPEGEKKLFSLTATQRKKLQALNWMQAA